MLPKKNNIIARKKRVFNRLIIESQLINEDYKNIAIMKSYISKF